MDYFESEDGRITRVWRDRRPAGVEKSRLTRARPKQVQTGMRTVGPQVIKPEQPVTPDMVWAEAKRRIDDVYPAHLSEVVTGRDRKRMLAWIEAIEEIALTLSAGDPIPDDYELDHWWRVNGRKPYPRSAPKPPEMEPHEVLEAARDILQTQIKDAVQMNDTTELEKAVRNIEAHLELLNLFTRAQHAADKNVSGYRWENPLRDFEYDTDGDGVKRKLDANDFLDWAYVRLAELRA